LQPDATKKNPLQPVHVTPADAREILGLIDLTSLGDQDTDDSINHLCDKALSAPVPVAAACIYPRFLPVAAKRLQGSGIQLAAVANFPKADESLADVVLSIKHSIRQGATEIDVVFPYSLYLQGNTTAAAEFIRQCKLACPDPLILKVILETGALADPAIIGAASRDAIIAGADFLKTSTGKIATGATLEAAAVMLLAIHAAAENSNRVIGFKASGGIRELEQAHDYLTLAKRIMGAQWVSPRTFRFGATQLFDTILATL
jgi:deoxyribose-phosphate aldolase